MTDDERKERGLVLPDEVTDRTPLFQRVLRDETEHLYIATWHGWSHDDLERVEVFLYRKDNDARNVQLYEGLPFARAKMRELEESSYQPGGAWYERRREKGRQP